MELSEGTSSTTHAPGAVLGEPDAGPGCASLELPRADPGKLQGLPLGPRAHGKDPDLGSPGTPTTSGDGPLDLGPSGGPNGGAKLPNRDSGIDSPSCSVVSEQFPCEEGGEASRGPAVLGHLEAAPEGEAVREAADSNVGEGNGEEPDPKSSPLRAPVDPVKCPKSQKLLHIAQELLHTEETYVKRLHLLDQVFCAQLVEAGIPSEVTTGIFSNISSIYRFHGHFLLPELQTRITQEWDTNPRLGDILQKLAPFLKMYGEYVKNFDRAVELVSTWTQRSPLFKDIVQSIQKQDVCGNLTLQHHMLEPVQRVPRYELLLKDYLKRLPRDAPDWKDAERSLELISTAANHSNAAIRKMEKMHKLLEVYERLGGEEDIVNPANELIKEGPIQKLSAKSGSAQDRHLFLFNSMILYCVPKLRLMGQKFSVREKMDISGLQVQDIVKSNAAHTFIIKGRKRSLELQTRTEEEKKEWIQLESRRGSAKTGRDKEKLGCRSCGEAFNSITKRKHRCKLCGVVICGKCSEFKAENGRQSRVCRGCFLTQRAVPESPSPEVAPEEPKHSTEGPAAVDPQPSLLCGHLQVSDSGAAWSEVWATIPASDPLELVLHLQEDSQDGWPPRTVPLSGCTVSVLDPAEMPDSRHVWRLQRGQQSLYLSTPSVDLQKRWLEALSAAARGDPGLAAL
uniref:FYVE, RhoGEF and PH domain containing 3 n=1 Tax=Canis lupus dingo TaxID=286419 RepID=A0A8C0K8D7_CANLU